MTGLGEVGSRVAAISLAGPDGPQAEPGRGAFLVAVSGLPRRNSRPKSTPARGKPRAVGHDHRQ